MKIICFKLGINCAEVIDICTPAGELCSEDKVCCSLMCNFSLWSFSRFCATNFTTENLLRSYYSMSKYIQIVNISIIKVIL